MGGPLSPTSLEACLKTVLKNSLSPSGEKKLPAAFASLESNSWTPDFRITTEEGLGRNVWSVMCRRLQAEAQTWVEAAGKQVLHPPGRVLQRAGLEEGAGG